MTTTPSTLSAPPPRSSSALTRWFQPRATERDAAFRERSIRVALGIFIVGVVISFATVTFLFRAPFELVSFPSLTLVVLILCGLSAVAVNSGHLLTAGWLLISTPLVGAVGLILIVDRAGTFSVIGLVAFMLLTPFAALILPRRNIMPLSIISSIAYGVTQFGLTITDFTSVIGTSTLPVLAQAVIVLLLEGAVLRQLRVEFDARLAGMALAINQAEQAKSEAESARQLAENANRAKSQFLSTMSHELRTPLNAIIGYDEAMIGGMVGEFDDEQMRLLKNIQHNSRRLLALINDVLDLSKIESGSLEIYLAPMSPRKVITETIESLRSLAEEKRIFLETNISANVPELILSDTKKIQQILVNLIGNSIKFTQQGGVYVDVDVLDREHWQFIVRDTGIGMPADAPSYIFEPFRQVDGTDTRKYKGTGLGLSIVKRLVENLGGKIEAKTELGKGSSFTVVLPRVNIPDAVIPEETPVSQAVVR